MKISALVIAATAFLSAAPSFAQAITPFSLPWVNSPARDAVYNMADHPTGIFVLEAFQNFCPYCNDNAPLVDALYQKYAAQDRVQVIDLDLDTDPSEIQAWITKYNPVYPLVSDAQSVVFSQIPNYTDGIPQTVVLDCKGNIVAHTEGEWDDTATATITSAIDAQLAQTCSATN